MSVLPEKLQAWECSECHTPWTSEGRARKCCSNIKVVTGRYECCDCPSKYPTEKEARDCCAGTIDVRITCSTCGNYIYGDSAEALREIQRCCQTPDEIEQFKCVSCETIHERREDAEECCPKDPEYKPRWRCTNCGSLHERLTEAKDCC